MFKIRIIYLKSKSSSHPPKKMGHKSQRHKHIKYTLGVCLCVIGQSQSYSAPARLSIPWKTSAVAFQGGTGLGAIISLIFSRPIQPQLHQLQILCAGCQECLQWLSIQSRPQHRPNGSKESQRELSGCHRRI